MTTASAGPKGDAVVAEDVGARLRAARMQKGMSLRSVASA